MFQIPFYITEKFEITLSYMISINDGVNSVLFASDNQKEIMAVKQYFEPIWRCEYGARYSSLYICEIRSMYLEDYSKLFSLIPFKYVKNIFYDLQDGYMYENEEYYVCSRVDKNGITIFRKLDKKILFLRSDAKVQNVHISQLIKEPLNCEQKIKGHVLLHCSACVFQNQAYVFPAQKSAGKSTLLMGMLACNSDYLANDSLFAFVKEGKIFLRKNPHAIRLGKETIENNYFLKSFFDKPTNCKMSKMLYSNIILNGKVQFVPEAIEKIFVNSKIYQDEIELKYIVFPDMKIETIGEVIKQISTKDAKNRLNDNLKNNDHRICWLPFYNEKQLIEAELKGGAEILEVLSGENFLLQYSGNAIAAAKIIIKRTKEK